LPTNYTQKSEMRYPWRSGETGKQKDPDYRSKESCFPGMRKGRGSHPKTGKEGKSINLAFKQSGGLTGNGGGGKEVETDQKRKNFRTNGGVVEIVKPCSDMLFWLELGKTQPRAKSSAQTQAERKKGSSEKNERRESA